MVVNPYAGWSLQDFLDALSVQYGRTHTVNLAAFQQMERLLIANWQRPDPQVLRFGGHTVYCEPDPSLMRSPDEKETR